jgi:hypothetical protein
MHVYIYMYNIHACAIFMHVEHACVCSIHTYTICIHVWHSYMYVQHTYTMCNIHIRCPFFVVIARCLQRPVSSTPGVFNARYFWRPVSSTPGVVDARCLQCPVLANSYLSELLVCFAETKETFYLVGSEVGAEDACMIAFCRVCV